MTRITQRKRLKAERDPKQMVMAPNRLVGCKPRQPVLNIHMSFTNIKYRCPFCLYIGAINEFYIQTKKGVSQKRARCPDCNTLMYMRSLTKHMTVEEYAEWVFNYSLSGFWKKCPYEKFKTRMKKLGWSRRFWDRYRALIGEKQGTSYEEYQQSMKEQ